MSFETGKRFYDARTKLSGHNKNGKPESIQSVYRNTNVPASSIALYENGNRLPNMENAQKLADYYGVNVSWLLGKSDSYSLDEGNQMVTQVTGLSADAVSILCGLRGDQRKIDCLNLLLTSSHFNRALTMLSLAKRISDSNSQDDKIADLIEELNYSGINEGMKPENSAVSNRQLIRMYRNDALLDVGNAFRKIAPADNEERKGN